MSRMRKKRMKKQAMAAPATAPRDAECPLKHKPDAYGLGSIVNPYDTHIV